MSKKIPPMSSQKLVKILNQGNARYAIFEREKDGRMYRTPVIMAKSDLSSKYVKLVLHQLGFTDAEVDALI